MQFIKKFQEGGAAPAPEGQPVYRRGGRLVRYIKK